MKRTFLFSLLSSFFLMSSFQFAHADSGNTPITSNLSLGSSGAQVLLLQKVLNMDPETQVAVTGPGSPGKETLTFGARTASSVARFQQKYASEVLALAGLTKPNGYVGFYTRAKLNELAIRAWASAPTVATQTASSTVPAASTTPAMGTNNVLSAAQVFLFPSIQVASQLTEQAVSPNQPVLTGSLPATADTNTVITVTGSQFDATNNTINSSLGQITHVPSVNGQLQFKIADFPQAKTFAANGFPQGMPVTYGIQTPQGISINYGKFILSSSVAETPFVRVNVLARKLFDVLSGAGQAFAYGRTSDGGTISSIKQICYCSGGTEIQFNSYVDHSTHNYFYSLFSTELYSNYNLFTSGTYYLTSLFPVGVCTYGSYCSSSDFTEGTLWQTGTS